MTGNEEGDPVKANGIIWLWVALLQQKKQKVEGEGEAEGSSIGGDMGRDSAAPWHRPAGTYCV